jgi:hypothetical protein
MAGSLLGAVGTVANSGAGAGVAKGWLICSTTDRCGGTVADGLRHSIWLAMPANSENGTRNLTDAAIQSLWRTAARFLRRTSVTRPTTQQNSVDCHK